MLAVTQDNELDRGVTKVAAGVQRHCALTRELKPVDDMIRFVVGPGSHVVPDVKRKLPGRGLWVTGTREAIAEAVKRNVFARGFKRDVRVSADLAGTAEQMLERSALDALAIAGKAGRLVTGFAKVEAALAQDDIEALIHASRRCGRRHAQAQCCRPPCSAKWRKNRAKPRSSTYFPAGNWIWH